MPAHRSTLRGAFWKPLEARLMKGLQNLTAQAYMTHGPGQEGRGACGSQGLGSALQDVWVWQGCRDSAPSKSE